MKWVDLCTLGLAVWRLSYILTNEKGPLDLATKLRKATGMQYDVHDHLVSYPSWNPLFCVYCTSVWAALVLWILPKPIRQMLAASTLAVLIHDARTRWL